MGPSPSHIESGGRLDDVDRVSLSVHREENPCGLSQCDRTLSTTARSMLLIVNCCHVHPQTHISRMCTRNHFNLVSFGSVSKFKIHQKCLTGCSLLLQMCLLPVLMGAIRGALGSNTFGAGRWRCRAVGVSTGAGGISSE